MIFVTQLIYIKEGQEETFERFEEAAIPAIGRYNGRLLLRLRPGDDAFISGTMNKPYEVHLAEFDSEEDFENFKHDEERRRFLHLKEQSIAIAINIQGVRL
ncbi:MAG: DUF1330 domain-containing protein [Chryseolinea sp.]